MEHQLGARQENVRSDQEANALINDAIKEVLAAFGSEMSKRDREMLESVTTERSTTPLGRVVYLQQTIGAVGVSENLKDYVNQVLQTLRQRFTPEEQKRFRNIGFKSNLLDDLT